MNENNFSVKEATFIIENAFFEEKMDYAEFEKTVKQTVLDNPSTESQYGKN